MTANEVRAQTEKLCKSLAIEDFGVQSMPDVSPPKWHLAHTSWFFEQFLLQREISNYTPFHRDFSFLFNSYYESVGEHLERSRRGLLSRPTVDEILRYRAHVTDALAQVERTPETERIIELGLHHEQQHQELLLTDIKHIFWSNPLKPVYASRSTIQPSEDNSASVLEDWTTIDEGLYETGYEDEADQPGTFCFDNEKPRHAVYLNGYEIQNRLITNGEYLEFIESGGYENPALWLSQGWDHVQRNGWKAPLYWTQNGNDLSDPSDPSEMTLAGMLPLDPRSPVVHVSYFEADAFARWRGARLPTEAEWEVYSERFPIRGSFLESGRYHPCAGGSSAQLWGEVWQWTASAYSPYPGYRPFPDAFAEYNGKFMSNQMVLRGGSCATPRSHIRATYRNYFAPETRWQFSGIRLAR